MTDTLEESLKKVREAETLITTRFATNEPEKLVNIAFQKRFIRAKSN